MMEIQTKYLPGKKFETVYECKLDEPEMNKQIKKIIDKYGDRMNHKTNVKAQMTEWKMWNEPGFNKLANIMIECVKQITNTKNIKVALEMIGMWGMKYKSEEHTVDHDHWPATYSCAYYLNAPKDAPGLLFTELGEQGALRKIEPGLLVFFKGDLRHAVMPTKFKGNRYVVSANFYCFQADQKE